MLPTHAARRPVAAGEVAGGHLLGAAVAVPQGADDPVAAGREAGQLDVALDPGAAGGQPVAKDRLGLGLGDEQQEGEGGVGQAKAEQAYPQGPAAPIQPQHHRVVAAPQQLRGRLQPTQHLEGAWLHDQGPGLVHPVGQPVHDPERHPQRLQRPGQGQPGRPGPHDQDVQPTATRIGHMPCCTRA